MSTTEQPLSTDEILKKKEELQRDKENNQPKSDEKLVNGNATNGHDPETMDTENGVENKSDQQNGEEISKINGKVENSEKSMKICTDEAIKLKRKRIQEVAEKLANEEARYTVLKKIRLSQLSTENAAKEAQAEAALKSELENKNNNSNNSQSSTKASSNKFVPIQPAKANSGGKNTPVLSPTPKMHRGTPTFDNSPKPKNKKLSSKDLDDVRQLADFLANNQKMSENDIKAAKTLVFRKQLNKSLAICDPPQPEQPDIIFFPSNNSVDFVNLVGLEQVVTHIKAMNAKKKPVNKV